MRRALGTALIAALALSSVAWALTHQRAAFIGESVLGGLGAWVVSKPPSYVPTLTGCYWPINVVDNYCTGGHTAADCLVDWTNSVKGNGGAVLFLSCGMNSVRDDNPFTVASIEAALDQIATEANAEGRRVVWSNIIPGGSQPTCSVTCTDKITAINAHIQTVCAGLANCHFVDAYTAFKGAGTGLSAECDHGDGQHLTEPCTQQFAIMLAAGLL